MRKLLTGISGWSDAPWLPIIRNLAGFQLTNNSPEYNRYSTYPARTELRRILRNCFDREFLSSEDSFWFFFSGHGVRYNDKDYLMPLDGDPAEPDETAIELNYVTERLTRSGAGQVVVILDACRSEGQKHSQTDFGQDMPQGVTTIFSCNPKEPAYEIGDPINQSAFTHVLLQSFQQQTTATALTITQLEQHLQTSVPKLNQQYNKPTQKPHIRCDVAANGNKVLLPHLRVPLTVEQLKAKAFRAEALQDWTQAQQLWLQVLRRAPAHTPDHQEAEAGYERVILKRQGIRATGQKEATAPPSPPSTPPFAPSQRAAETTPPIAEPPEDDLSSECNIDYTRLRDLLKAEEWKAADLETAHRMLEAVGRGEDDWIRYEELAHFPCADLRTIDRLWVKYSQGRFGFSVQKEIYVKCGAKLDGKYPGDKIWDRFGDQVGWRVKGKWIYSGTVKFNTSAPSGHLPFGVEVREEWVRVGGLWGVNVFSRIQTCKV